MRRAVITGMGVVSALGVGQRQTAERMRRGHNGIGAIRQFPVDGFPVRIAGEITDAVFPSGNPRMAALARQVLEEALSEAQLPAADAAQDRALVWAVGKPPTDLQMLGRVVAGVRGTDVIEEQMARAQEAYVNAEERPRPQQLLSGLAQRAGVGGARYSCYTACASGNDALGMAKRIIERGQAEVVIAGATDSQIDPLSLLEFELLSALAHEGPERACRPFDRHRTGFVVGEGAAAFVLEEAGHAEARGARPLAQLAGYGSSLDCFGLTKCHPQGRGAAQAIGAALHDAGLRPGEIDYINAHGTGTVLNDQAEAAALRRVWGDAAARVPVSSTKAMTGHLIAAASAVEAVLTVLAMRESFIPPTLNYSTPDPDCLLNVVAGEARAAHIGVAMSNGFGFGGQNSSLILRNAAGR